MTLYAKMRETWINKDVKGHRECFHDDWQFVFHSSGKVITRADDLPDEEFKEFAKEWCSPASKKETKSAV